MKMDRRKKKELSRMGNLFLPNVGMKRGMNVNVVRIGEKVVIDSHPKDLSKSPTLAGFFVCIDDG